jgi:hypothetical protein
MRYARSAVFRLVGCIPATWASNAFVVPPGHQTPTRPQCRLQQTNTRLKQCASNCVLHQEMPLRVDGRAGIDACYHAQRSSRPEGRWAPGFSTVDRGNCWPVAKLTSQCPLFVHQTPADQRRQAQDVRTHRQTVEQHPCNPSVRIGTAAKT